MSVTDDRPLRADARRNRDAIVKAARSVFGKHGKEAQMEDVARRAKVGVGTVYRHFPTKDALLEAIVLAKFDDIAANAVACAKIEDPLEAWTTFLYRGAEMGAVDRALGQMLTERSELMSRTALEHEQLTEATGVLMRRAKDAGHLREDFRPTDIGMVMCALRDADAQPGSSWQRMFAIVLAGLRPTGEPLPD